MEHSQFTIRGTSFIMYRTDSHDPIGIAIIHNGIKLKIMCTCRQNRRNSIVWYCPHYISFTQDNNWPLSIDVDDVAVVTAIKELFGGLIDVTYQEILDHVMFSGIDRAYIQTFNPERMCVKTHPIDEFNGCDCCIFDLSGILTTEASRSSYLMNNNVMFIPFDLETI